MYHSLPIHTNKKIILSARTLLVRIANMNKSEQLKKEQILGALEKSLGIVSTACDSIGISRTTYYKYYNEDEEFKQSVDSIGDIALDCAESQLFELIKEKNVTSIIFYLKTKGKKRGYIEKQEIDPNSNNITGIKLISDYETTKDKNLKVEFV